jgi:hypothetical protein
MADNTTWRQRDHPALAPVQAWSAEVAACRASYSQANAAYISAQRKVLAACEQALPGNGVWPLPEEYERTRALGQLASEARRRYLSMLNVPEHRPRTRHDRTQLIQRISESERVWQPLPEDWLKQQE